MDLNGFDRGLEAEKVITIVKQDEQTLICVKFKDQPSPELIPIDVVKPNIPQMLIDFYVDHLHYDQSDQEEEEVEVKEIKTKTKKIKTKEIKTKKIKTKELKTIKRKGDSNMIPKKKVKQQKDVIGEVGDQIEPK